MSQDRSHNVGWGSEMQDNIVGGVGDDDFSKFLDLDNDFSNFGNMNNGHSGLDTPMGRLGFGTSMPQQGMPFNHQDQMNIAMPPTTDSISYQNIPTTQQYATQYSQYQQMQMAPHYHIPPTPVSAEMHAAKYVQMENANRYQFDHQQVSFTPLVSPAQTPLDNGFGMSDYGLGDEFFSPLTSPAIEAQHAYSHTGATSSPVDLNAEPSAGSKATTPGQKRARRKGSMSGRPIARSVRQSPAMKAQSRRRHPSLTSLPMEKIKDMLPQGGQGSGMLSAPNSAILRASDDSVSPEPLSESIMRPPPTPAAGKSPIALQGAQNPASNSAVTPATLMRMPSNQNLNAKNVEQPTSSQANEEVMEDIMLPDAATSNVQPLPLPTIDASHMTEENEATPILSAKSAKLSAASTPRSTLTRGFSNENFAKPGKVEGRGGGRTSKKRQSTSSAAISPALRPKISPSISPLAPATGPGLQHISPETSALYLASKSNYQNILEGTHLPGVSYPETLAENLTSKRTSHKIAEQGRRNRINLALKEIEGLLPAHILGAHSKKPQDRASPNENDDGETGGKASSGQGASKASTVEMAIVYIKSLQAELKDTKNKLETVEKKLADGGSSAGSQASD